MATTIETPSVISAAHCAFILTTPSRMNSTTSGSTAKIEVSPKEWETGSRTCLYTMTSLIAALAACRVPVATRTCSS
jgi:hypothetical protein